MQYAQQKFVVVAYILCTQLVSVVLSS